MVTISGVFFEERVLDFIEGLLVKVDDIYPLALFRGSLHAVYESLFVQEESVWLGVMNSLEEFHLLNPVLN